MIWIIIFVGAPIVALVATNFYNTWRVHKINRSLKNLDAAIRRLPKG